MINFIPVRPNGLATLRWLLLALALWVGAAVTALGQTPEPPPIPRMEAPQQTGPRTTPVWSSQLGRERALHMAIVQGGIAYVGGDMRRRYGNQGLVGLAYAWAPRGRTSVGFRSAVSFGGVVKEDPLSSLRDQTGFVAGADGSSAEVVLGQLGFVGPALTVGRIIPLNRFTGPAFFKFEHALMIEAGPTLLYRRTRIDDLTRSVPLLRGRARRGYDQAVGGLGGMIAARYMLMAPTTRYAFFLEPSLTLASTRPLRAFDYNTGRVPEGRFVDALLGFQVGLSLLFYKLDDQEVFFY